MKTELYRFLLFLFVLSLFASLLSSFRTQDKIFSLADGGLTLVKDQNPLSFFDRSYNDYLAFVVSLVSGKAKTSSGEPIYLHIGSRLLPTFHLALFSIFFGAGLGIFLSLLPLYFRSFRLHQTLKRCAEIILSTPVFVFAILLLILFFYKLDLLPPGGYEPFSTYYVVLPGIALGIRVFARVYIFQAKEVWNESSSPYVLLTQTRGYPWGHIVFNEIQRKVFPLTLIVIILDFSSLISGAMIVEEIFFFPGIGKSLFFSIKAMDAQLLSTLLLYIGIVFYSMNRIAFHWQKVLLGENREFKI